MESQTQELELEALKAIYSEDFIEIPPSNVWKGVTTYPEFKIRVRAEEPFRGRVEFVLHVKFSKTYPRVAPTLAIKEFKGLSKAQINQLMIILRAEAQKLLGREMIFELVNFGQEWITNKHSLPQDATPRPSLAVEMETRAVQQQKANEERIHAEEERRRQADEEFAASIARQIDQKKEEKRRRRTLSNVTDVAAAMPDFDSLQADNIQTFNDPIKHKNLTFTSVVLSNGTNEGVGVTYRADPDCDLRRDQQAPIFEAHRVIFDHSHYKSNYGYKKIIDVEREITRIKGLDHPNLTTIFASRVEIVTGIPTLTMLLEQRPPISLKNVLQFSDGLKLDRALDYFNQLLAGLTALHSLNISHRGLTAECIGLSPIPQYPSKSRIKISRCSYYSRIMELHRSNNIVHRAIEDWVLPHHWLPPEAIDRPLDYPESRDVWCAGVIFLQMLLGFDVVNQYSDYQSALASNPTIPESITTIVTHMFTSNRKKSPACLFLTRKLSHITGSQVLSTPSAMIPIPDVRTPVPRPVRHSPEVGFFAPMQSLAAQGQRSSRYKEDWEELEFLGKGGFGSVVKTRNKLDGRIYAIKKIKLRGTENDEKIFREVNALSRLNHRYIVRYFATWLETDHTLRHSQSTSFSGSDSGSDQTASHIGNRWKDEDEDVLRFNLDDLTGGSTSKSKSFPSIHFGDESSRSLETDEEGSDEDSDDDSPVETASNSSMTTHVRPVPRVLYIQMEFVEQQTLRELVSEAKLEEDHAWTLFRQILEAVVHISSLGILHRDIKLSNIFMDSKGDCKLGDFGLATSSLAAVDPSDVEGNRPIVSDGEMTSAVGTSLYVAPEVLNSRSRNHNKADMYSLGIVFFEMNYRFNTGSERVAVLQQLRSRDIIFPPDFNRPNQEKVIRWLLQHDPAQRPTAAELLHSQLMPQQMEDTYFQEAFRLMANPSSTHYGKLLTELFSRPMGVVKDAIYDDDERPEHATLEGVVEERLTACFKLHGAVHTEPLLLLPATAADVEDTKSATFLDRHGDLVALPKHAIFPFARLAGRMGVERIKRFHIGNIYKSAPGGGHPRTLRVAVFDIITTDPSVGISEAEAIGIVSEIIDLFPGVSNTQYEVHVTHSQIIEAALGRLSSEQKQKVIEILENNRASPSQKKSLLSKLGFSRTTVEELDLLLQPDDIEASLSRLSKTSFGPQLHMAMAEIRTMVHFTGILGVKHKLLLHPYLGNQEPFNCGLQFEFSKGPKRSDVIASGGRYDQVLSRQQRLHGNTSAHIRATGVQIAVDKITLGLAAHQRNSIKQLLKEKRSYGVWSPRRCDVYIAGYQRGNLAERLELAALLWQNEISADLMYESAVEGNEESNIAMCQREGILFLIHPRPGPSGRQTWRIKSVLRGIEEDVLRHELVPTLQAMIQEQRRVDKSQEPVAAAVISKPKDLFDVPLILAPDHVHRKQRQATKHIYQAKANAVVGDLRDALENPVIIGVDVPAVAWNAITATHSWIQQDSAWKQMLDEHPAVQKEVVGQLREQILAKRANGCHFVYVFSVRDEKLHMYHLA